MGRTTPFVGHKPVVTYIEYRRSFAFARRSFSVWPRCAAGTFPSMSSTIRVAAAIFCTCTACFTRSAPMRAFSLDKPASSGAIVSISSMSFRDSSKRLVFAKDFTARSSIAKRWTVPGSRGTTTRWGRVVLSLPTRIRATPVLQAAGASGRPEAAIGAPSLVPGHLGLDLVGPLVDPADEVLHLAEPELPKEIRDAPGPSARLAVHDDLVGGAELVHTRGHLRDGHEDRPVQPRDLPFHRFPHIEEDDLTSFVDPLFQLLDRDLELLAELLRWAAKPAELLVIDEFLDRRVGAAHRAGRVLPEAQFAELHAERIEHEQAADQRVAFPQQEFDRLDRLDRTDDPRQDAEDAAFRTRGHEARGRRFRVEAAVARALLRVEDARLAFEPEDRAVDVRLLQEDGRVVHEVPRREVVSPVDDHVVVLQDVHRVV